MPESNKILVLFDFDGTLVPNDVFIDFLKFYLWKKKPLLKLPPVLLMGGAYFLRIISNSKAKEAIFSILFKGITISTFNELISEFYERHEIAIRSSLLKRLKQDYNTDADIWVVSANFEALIKPVLQDFPKIKVLSTRLHVENNRLTGGFDGVNNHGVEKVNRIHSAIGSLREYKEIHAYGDSPGDLPMLQLATHTFYREF